MRPLIEPTVELPVLHNQLISSEVAFTTDSNEGLRNPLSLHQCVTPWSVFQDGTLNTSHRRRLAERTVLEETVTIADSRVSSLHKAKVSNKTLCKLHSQCEYLLQHQVTLLTP